MNSEVTSIHRGSSRHLGRRIELERLILDIEAQPGKRLLVALEEGGRPSAGDAVEGRDPLLAVQDQYPEGRGRGYRGLAPYQRTVRHGLPGEQAANRIAEVQGAHQPADLVAVPYVATLELGQQHASRVDLVKNGGQLGHDLSLARYLKNAANILATWRQAVPGLHLHDADKAVAVCKAG